MKVEEGKYSIAEIVGWYRDRTLVANKEYQRGGGLWPQAAKSYFIDTLLKDFPFPKLYFHERVDKETKRPRREIVDGQQRVSTIASYAANEFALGSNSQAHAGKFFEELDEDTQDAFWSYTVSVDVIRNADRADILQMFRRMNAFTLPLNPAEKRHSEFFGEFKDWVNRVLDNYGRMLVDWSVLTARQVVRMSDAEFVADVALAIEEGIVSTSPTKLSKLYRKYDTTFDAQHIKEQTVAAFETILDDLSEVQATFIVKPHIFHSLVCALIHNRYGLPRGEEEIELPSIGVFFPDAARAVIGLRRLAAAHEENDLNIFGEYTQAASEGGNRATQRLIRVRWLCRALRGDFAD